MKALRGSRPFSWLALLAILAQLLLPVQHAAAMGRASGDPLHLAFCGQASAQALQTLRETAPPELLQALAKASDSADQANQHTVSAACSLCAGLSSLQIAALGGQAPVFALAANAPVLAVAFDAQAPVAAQTRQPSQRGPPSYS